jgi:adenylate kinase
MQNSGFSQQKQDENLAAEILDVCLIEALQLHPKEKVCELDATGKTVENTLKEVLMVLDGKKECSVGAVDWLGMLEQMGKVDEFLKT